MVTQVFDTTTNCTNRAAALRQQGVQTIIRYYCRPDLAWKRLTQGEAAAIAQAGVKLGAVYQDRQNQVADFSDAKGRAAGQRAYDYAENVIFQPPGSTIYFSVDYDASEADITSGVIPFFTGVKAAFAEGDGGGAARYAIGAYASGRTLRMLLEAGLITHCWITQSTGFAEYRKFLNSGKWHLKQGLDVTIAGVEGDPNEVNPVNPSFGDFVPDVSSIGPVPPGPTGETAGHYVVIASGGLRVRSGPGTTFDITGVLPVGAAVVVLSRVGDWAMIDTSGDGRADGFVFASYLRAA